MANVITRWIRAVFDRDAAKKVEDQLTESLASAGKKGGDGFLKELRAAFEKKMAELRTALARGVIDPAQFKKLSNDAAKQFNAGLLQGMDAARKAGTLTDREFQKLSKTLKKVGDDGKATGGILQSSFAKVGGFLAASFGAAKIADFFRGSIAEASAAEESITRFGLALEKVGLTYAQVAPEAEAYFAQLQLTTKYTDDDARDALTNLITITGDYNKSLKLLSLTADVAAKRHVTMAEASETVAKASLGLSKGMQDLGIKAGETGDIVGKLRTNIGGFAEAEGKTFGGRVAILNNLWGEFKEKVGAAIIGSNNLGGAIGRMQAAIITLTEWVDKNGKSLGVFLDRLVSAGEAIVRISGFIVTHTPNLYTLSKAYDWLTGKIKGVGEASVATTAAIVAGAATRRQVTAEEQAVLAKLLEEGGDAREKLTTREVKVLERIRKEAAAGHLTLAKAQDDAIADFFKARQDAAEKAAATETKAFRDRKAEIVQEIADLQRLRAAQGSGNPADQDRTSQTLKDEADKRKALTGLTKEHAKELGALIDARNRERDAIKAGNEKKQEEIDLENTYRELLDADRAEDARRKKALTDITDETEVIKRRNEAQRQGPDAVAALDRELYIQNKLLEAGVTVWDAHAAAVAKAAGEQYDAAAAFSDPWTDALGLIREEVFGAGTLFHDLGQAWAQGGFAGIVQLAKAKVKENIAAAIENAARAFGALGLGNPLAAQKFRQAAVQHGIAAVAWGGVASFSGSGGGGGGGGGGGTSSGGSLAANSSSSQPPGPDITIILDGPGFDATNPRVQEVVLGAQRQARERYGENANVRVVRKK